LEDNDQWLDLFMHLHDYLIHMVSLWYISDIDERNWEALAGEYDKRAEVWHTSFYELVCYVDVTPFHHCIAVHFGDLIRRRGPLVDQSSKGLEASHKPLK
jgi:hypothetical protein